MKKRLLSPAREAADETPRSTSTKGLRLCHIFAYFIAPPLIAVLSGCFSLSWRAFIFPTLAVMLADVLLRWRFKKRHPDVKLPVTTVEEIFDATPHAAAVGYLVALAILREAARLLVHR